MHAAVSLPTELPTCAGFKQAGSGGAVSRTIMLADLTTLLAAAPGDARFVDYRAAIIDGNVLAKRRPTTRREALRRLSEFYALDPAVPLFAALRRLWDADTIGRPLLACLAANARDPLLRLTAPAILAASFGDPVSAAGLTVAIEELVPGRFPVKTLASMSRHAASSWTQSGHLAGRMPKTRARAVATPAAVAYALLLGHLAGKQGILLFDTFWVKLLDAGPERVHDLAFEAGRRGWLDYKRIGDVAEIGFKALLVKGRHE